MGLIGNEFCNKALLFKLLYCLLLLALFLILKPHGVIEMESYINLINKLINKIRKNQNSTEFIEGKRKEFGMVTADMGSTEEDIC